MKYDYAWCNAFAAATEQSVNSVRGHMRRGSCTWPRRQVTGHSSHPLYELYHSIRQRCYNPAASGYSRYGSQGVGMSPGWYTSFKQFTQDLAVLGPRPAGYSIDRIDGRRGYEPGNIRWADKFTQSQNRSVVQEATNIYQYITHGYTYYQVCYQRGGQRVRGSFRTRELAEKFIQDLKEEKRDE